MKSYTVTVSRDLAPQEYKGFTIEKEDEPWAIKYCGEIKFYNDEHIHHAESVEEAKDKIDETFMEATEKKVSHTPGPWEIRYSSGIDMDIISQEGKICQFRGYSHSIELMDENQDQEVANAKLIAAAPDLLRACQECIKVFDEAGIAADFMTNAIKKATE